MMPLAMLNTPDIGRSSLIPSAVMIHTPTRYDGFPRRTHDLGSPFPDVVRHRSPAIGWCRLLIYFASAFLSTYFQTPQHLIGHHLLSGCHVTCRRIGIAHYTHDQP
jgi:hypothetical protein